MGTSPRWKQVRFREFRRQHGTGLEARHHCGHCRGPIAEAMRACPWCGQARSVHKDATRFPARCPRCRRGRKLDWRFCPWCYGGAFRKVSTRRYTDKRYLARCRHCGSSRLMRFMKYCPDCNRKVSQRWKIEGAAGRCPRCGWGVLADYWKACPWCGRRLGHG